MNAPTKTPASLLICSLRSLVSASRKTENALYGARERQHLYERRLFWERRLAQMESSVGDSASVLVAPNLHLATCERRIEELWSDGFPNLRRDELLLETFSEMESRVHDLLELGHSDSADQHTSSEEDAEQAAAE